MTQVRYDILTNGAGFIEGPVWREETRDVVFCSITTGRVMRWSEGDGLSVYCDLPTGAPNGLTADADGSVYVAQCGGNWPAPIDVRAPGGVQRVTPDGELEWVTLHPVSPNDLCFGPDGWLYVTDPTRPLRDDGRVWRIDVESGASELILSLPGFVNGIGFDANDDLYVSSTNDRSILRFPFEGDGVVGPPEVALTLEHNHPDGFAFDQDNNLTIAAVSHDDRPGDVQMWSLKGELLECFSFGEVRKITNLTLTPDATLYITASDDGQLLRVGDRPSAALPLHPFRK